MADKSLWEPEIAELQCTRDCLIFPLTLATSNLLAYLRMRTAKCYTCFDVQSRSAAPMDTLPCNLISQHVTLLTET